MLEAELPTGRATPAARRATVRVGIQHGGHFVPVLLQTPGAPDVEYTWNGSALVASGA